jgi:site-specific DNA recombinase
LAFMDQILEIVVPFPNKLIYRFKDGHETEVGWKDHSRRDSWTDEMKQQALERSIKQIRCDI